MAEKDYTFDPDSLTFKKNEEKKNGKRIIISIITQIVAAVFIGIVIFLTISNTIKTPTQNRLEQENAVMEEELKQLEEKYNKATEAMQTLSSRDKEIYRSVYEHEDLSEEDAYKMRYEELQKKDGVDLYNLLKDKSALSSKMLKDEEAAFNELKFKLLNYKEDLNDIPSILPVSDPKMESVYYGFGKKLDPIYKTPKTHNGIDISASIGTEIKASANGVVEYIGDSREHGRHITINHKNGYKTTYAHLSDYAVKKNQKVKRGEVIGFVGNTGKSLTPHLHYEISFNGQFVNPVHYFFVSIEPKEYSKLKTMATNGGSSLD